MSQAYTSVLVVRVQDIPTFPKAFRDYVEGYFAPRTLWGVECLYAVEALYYHVNRGCTERKGAAPSHSVDISHFKGGLEPKQSLLDWIEQAIRAGTVNRLNGSWNDGSREDAD